MNNVFDIGLALALLAGVYIWSRKLLGSSWAILPAALLAVSPNFTAAAGGKADIVLYIAIFLIAFCLADIVSIFALSLKNKSYGRLGADVIVIGASKYYLFQQGFLSIIMPNLDLALLSYLRGESIGTLALLAIASFFAVFNIVRSLKRAKPTFANYVAVNREEFVILITIVILGAIFILSGNENKIQALNPLIYILVASGIKNLVRLI